MMLPTKGVNDGGNARQRFRGKLDELHNPAVPCIFRQIDRRAHSQRQRQDQRDHNDVQGIVDGGQDAHGPTQDALRGGQEAPADPGDAFDTNVADQQHQQGAGDAAQAKSSTLPTIS